MTDQDTRNTDLSSRTLGFGSYEIVRPLRAGHNADRYLVADPVRLTHHVAFRYKLPGSDAATRRAFLDAVEVTARINCQHVLQVEQFAFASDSEAWIISPYTGDHDGLLLLSDLLADKGGQLEPAEVARSVSQLVAACESIEEQGRSHGPLTLQDIQVDRGGRLLVELIGLVDLESPRTDDSCRAQASSIVAIAYELLVGVRAEESPIPPSRLITGIAAGWDRFFEEGLDPARGFASVTELRDAMDRVYEETPVVEVRAKKTESRFGFIRRNSGV